MVSCFLIIFGCGQSFLVRVQHVHKTFDVVAWAMPACSLRIWSRAKALASCASGAAQDILPVAAFSAAVRFTFLRTQS